MSGGLQAETVYDRIYTAVSAVALSAALLVSLLALARHLHSASLVVPSADAETRPAATAATDRDAANADAYLRQLRAHLELQPRDARAWVIFARLQAEAGHFAQAAQAYENALALPSKVAGDAAVWCEFADALGMTQDGSLAGRPRELIDRALALNPKHPKALEMAGSAEYGQGDYAAALRFWRPLLALLEPQSEARAELAAAISRAERLAAAMPAARQ
jgi:cytochrome c-type biogenesis protein CcmH